MSLVLFNTLSKKKESFEPVSPPFVGMYVCGPTVYGDPHLGHARSAITFDIVFRYLLWLGYKVRYVRNITDVGHLENDADTGEDKIAKKARVEQVEPMEVAQYYTNRYHGFMDKLNVMRPSIEPHASGHIIEQIEMIEQIIQAGYAYVSGGSVYFDVVKYNQTHNYGILSGRVIDELLSNTRDNLDGQEEKHNSVDFALWKKASPEHIMRWKSPWSDGFPGWHLECSAMGKKYLGEVFDIHGGGMDLIFPHHESEIAQSCVANADKAPVKYWLHNNMITINGQKMGKSLGNAVALEEFFTGNHALLAQAYSPMTIRFFILQAHYRSTLDFSNEALQASEKGLKKLLEAKKTLNTLKGLSGETSEEINKIHTAVLDAMNDDFNTAIAISHLFDAVRIVNTANASLNNGASNFLTEGDIDLLKKLFNGFLVDVLGIEDELSTGSSGILDGVMNMILDIRQQAKANKDYALSDEIRNKLSAIGVSIKDGKDGAEWTVG